MPSLEKFESNQERARLYQAEFQLLCPPDCLLYRPLLGQDDGQLYTPADQYRGSLEQR